MLISLSLVLERDICLSLSTSLHREKRGAKLTTPAEVDLRPVYFFVTDPSEVKPLDSCCNTQNCQVQAQGDQKTRYPDVR